MISDVYTALTRLAAPPAQEIVKREPAVTVRASIKQDYIVCLEDGKKLKMLKRYLRTNYNMSPDDYRRKWDLPSDYPMVAPSYAEKRRSLAHSTGLGRRSAEVAEPAPEPTEEAAPAIEEAISSAPKAKRGRPAKVTQERRAEPVVEPALPVEEVETSNAEAKSDNAAKIDGAPEVPAAKPARKPRAKKVPVAEEAGGAETSGDA